MMKKLKRVTLIPLFTILSAMCLVACQFGDFYYPEPAENPVILTSQAQIKEVYVKHMNGITAENPEADIEDNNFDGIYPRWQTIENDWIKIKLGDDLPNETLQIIVKENTSGVSRSYHLRTSDRNYYETIVTITQSGKSYEYSH